MNDQSIIQVVMFKTKSGFTDADVLDAAVPMKTDVEAVDGCQRWELYKADDGHWVELIYWDSPAAAQQGNALMMTKASAARAFEMTDDSSVSVLQLSAIPVLAE